jgi:hypothetical protein
MTVGELLEVLRGHDPTTEVVMSIVAPIADDDEEIVTDLFTIDATFLWPDDDADGEVLWLVGGEEEDVERLLEEIESDEP